MDERPPSDHPSSDADHRAGDSGSDESRESRRGIRQVFVLSDVEVEAARRVRRLFGRDLHQKGESFSPLRKKVHSIIFEANTPAGRWFDISLLWVIVASVVVVMLDSVPSYSARYGQTLRTIEWVVTGIFSLEYVLRLWCVRKPMRYARSFFGVVDLLAVAPTYLSLFVAGTEVLAVIRVLRLLRVFRLFKLSQFVAEAEQLATALALSAKKIFVFLVSVLALTVVLGSTMYLIEGPESTFDSIPRSIYWAIVTLTTVGYGDISPESPLGQAIAAAVMILGYAIIAVPTGIVSAELVGRDAHHHVTTRSCPDCTLQGHATDADFCKHCGGRLEL